MAKRKKKRERGAGSGSLRDSPALVAAFRLQERAAEVGFDWPDANGPVAKVREELAELEDEIAREEGTAPRSPLPGVEEEVGDLLFAVVNLARKLHVDPSAALKQANDKFTRRFDEVKRLAKARGMQMGRASLEELDGLWEEAKAGKDGGGR